MKRKEGKEPLSKGAASGMVALVFLVLGFQLALFVVKIVERCPVKPGMTGVVKPGMTGVGTGHDGRSGVRRPGGEFTVPLCECPQQRGF